MDIGPEIRALIHEVVYQHYKTFTVCIVELVNGIIVSGSYFVPDASLFDLGESRERAFSRAIERVFDVLSYDMVDAFRASADILTFRRTG